MRLPVIYAPVLLPTTVIKYECMKEKQDIARYINNSCNAQAATKGLLIAASSCHGSYFVRIFFICKSKHSAPCVRENCGD